MIDIETTVYEITGELHPTTDDALNFDTVLGQHGIDWTDRDTERVPDNATNYCEMGKVLFWEEE